MENSVTVLILAAGLGTRMKSKKAKVLHVAGGRSLIEEVVETALSLAPPDRVFVVTGYGAQEVRETLASTGVRFVHQAEQRGTGHAVAACRGDAPGDGLALVIYGDCPLLRPDMLRRLVEQQAHSAAGATLVVSRMEDPTGYGRILRGPEGSLAAIVEQKAGTAEQLEIREVNPGIYCFRADLLWQHIGEIKPDNPACEYYLTDIVEILRNAGYEIGTLSHADTRELLGINTRVELAEADRILRWRTAERLMLEGVTIERPETVTIDSQVRIGRDTVVEAFAQILGPSVTGEDCRIGACSIVRNSELGNRVRVAPFTAIADSKLEDDVEVGPFARLRMETRVESGARIGNFVEAKKSRVGAGAKAMHLAYLGDSDIGEDVNIGAGTITCNFDGKTKHPTKIGDGAFVGSNSTLVAPLEIGRGSYVAAGSVVTKMVPPDALAIGRGRQENKLGWAKRRRGKSQ